MRDDSQVELREISGQINWRVANVAAKVIQLARKRNLISPGVTARRYLCTRVEAAGMDLHGLLSSSGQSAAATCVVAYFFRRELSIHHRIDRFWVLPWPKCHTSDPFPGKNGDFSSSWLGWSAVECSKWSAFRWSSRRLLGVFNLLREPRDFSC